MVAIPSSRRWCAWGVALPAMLLGSQLAHALAYRLAYPSLQLRVHALAASGHGYLAALPLALGVAGAVAACTVGWAVSDAARGRRSESIPPLAFAVLPPLAFTLQELTERWLAVGGLPWWMIEQPTFRIGLLLQLPFALAAYLVTRLLLRGAEELGRRLGVAQPRRRALAPRILSPGDELVLLSECRLAPWWTRGPP